MSHLSEISFSRLSQTWDPRFTFLPEVPSLMYAFVHLVHTELGLHTTCKPFTPSVGSSAACPLASPWLCGSSAFSPHLPSPQPAGDCSLNLQCSVKMPSPLSGLLWSPHDPKHMDYFLLWPSILSGCLSIWHISILNISRFYSECTFSLTQIGCEVCEGRSKLLMG